MAITDLFSSSFLFSIAIIVILIGGIFAYVSYRMTEQDHKLTSMVNLVSILAQEVTFLKQKINDIESNDNINDVENLEYSTQLIQPQLISVSDDEDDDEDNDEDIDEDEEDIEDDEESVDDLEDTEVKKLIIIKDEPNEHDENIKTITLTLDADNEVKDQEFIQLEEIINAENNNIETNVNEEIVNDENDYKKMDISTLRELVVSRGLTQDASKLKKKDILKLLEK